MITLDKCIVQYVSGGNPVCSCAQNTKMTWDISDHIEGMKTSVASKLCQQFCCEHYNAQAFLFKSSAESRAPWIPCHVSITSLLFGR